MLKSSSVTYYSMAAITVCCFAIAKSAPTQLSTHSSITTSHLNNKYKIQIQKREVKGTDNQRAKSIGQQDAERLIKNHIVTLWKKGDDKELASFLQMVAAEKTRRNRLERCISILGSRAICEHQVGFYIWAQLLAKDIMAGNA